MKITLDQKKNLIYEGSRFAIAIYMKLPVALSDIKPLEKNGVAWVVRRAIMDFVMAWDIARDDDRLTEDEIWNIAEEALQICESHFNGGK